MKKNALFAVVWAILILAAMCTSNARAFLFNQVIHYNWNWTPDFSELFIVSDVAFYDGFYLVQKAGHMISFAILYIFTSKWLRDLKKAFIICVAFALFSEILQLYFQRNGRLFDVGIDTLGIFLAFRLFNGFYKHKKAATN